MRQYLHLLDRVLAEGVVKVDRTGTGAASSAADATDDGFPLVTTKKLHVKSIVHELL